MIFCSKLKNWFWSYFIVGVLFFSHKGYALHHSINDLRHDLSIRIDQHQYSVCEAIVGVQVNHFYRWRHIAEDPRSNFSETKIVTYYPGAVDQIPTQLLNLNGKSPYLSNPLAFIVGDGSLSRALMLIDRIGESPLNHAIDGFIARMIVDIGFGERMDQFHHLLAAQDSSLLELIYRYLAEHTQDYITWPDQGDQENALPWDLELLNNRNLARQDRDWLAALEERMVDDPGIMTFKRHPVIPFEHYIVEGRGYCIQMVILASLVLERLAIPHNVVAGAVVTNNDDSSSGGHSWIFLTDGRILDVAWKTLSRPDQVFHSDQKDWMYFGNLLGKQFRFVYRAFNILKLLP